MLILEHDGISILTSRLFEMLITVMYRIQIVLSFVDSCCSPKARISFGAIS